MSSSTLLLSKTAHRDKMASFVAEGAKTKNGNMTYAHLNESGLKEGSASFDVKVQGKLAKYIANLKKETSSLNDKLRYSLAQRKKLKEKLSVCTNFIQTLDRGQKCTRSSGKLADNVV